MAGGAWLDTKTGKVVSSPPEEGVQLLSPNVEPTDADRAYVQTVKDAMAADATDAKTVTSKSAK